jgi:hypothetical protein
MIVKPGVAGGLSLLLAIVASPVAGAGTTSALAGAPRLPIAHDLPGTHCTAFPADNVWHASVKRLPVDKHNSAWMRSIGRGDDLHPDFGPSYGAQPVPYGIPITYVGASHPKVRVHFRYASESDHVRYPLGHDTKIEGGRHADGDRHAIVVDKSTCRLYETWLTRQKNGRWTAGSGATWSLTSNRMRPRTWTSADAAGLPILPGLLRWDEVRRGYVDHAIRFTAPCTAPRFIWPARHMAPTCSGPGRPPMGARFRLKPGFSISRFRPDVQVVLRAMKTYGLILADNGSSWYFQGEQSTHWPDGFIAELKQIPADAFQAVDESGLKISAGSARAR